MIHPRPIWPALALASTLLAAVLPVQAQEGIASDTIASDGIASDVRALEEARQRLDSVDESLRIAEQRKTDLLDEGNSIADQLNGLQAEAVAAALAIRQHEHDLQLMEAELALRREEEAAEEAAFTAENRTLAGLLGVLARLARLPAEPMILGDGDPNSQVRTALTTRTVIAAVEVRTADLRVRLERLTQVRTALEQRQQDAERARRTLDARITALNGIMETRRGMLNTAEARQIEAEQRVGRLSQEVGLVAQILRSLEAEAVRRAATAALDPPIVALPDLTEEPDEPEVPEVDPAVTAAILAMEAARPPATGVTREEERAAIEALASLAEATALPEPEPGPAAPEPSADVPVAIHSDPWRSEPSTTRISRDGPTFRERAESALALLMPSQPDSIDPTAQTAPSVSGTAPVSDAPPEPDAPEDPVAPEEPDTQVALAGPAAPPEPIEPAEPVEPADPKLQQAANLGLAPVPSGRPRQDHTPAHTADIGILTPVSGAIALGFGDQDALDQVHKGLTIATGGSLPVLSPMDGTVRFAGPFQEYGRLLIVEHEGGYHSLIAGLGRIDVAAGQRIVSGEPIGATPAPQTTGSSTVDIYFEFRQDGVPINPIRGLIVARKRGEG